MEVCRVLRELDSDFTGVENDMAPAETLALALRLLPGNRARGCRKRGRRRLSTNNS